jgi:peroxiredoxin, Ohr subfamily
LRTRHAAADKILYEAEVTATGGRDGKAASDDGLLSVSLSLPKSLGGPGGPGTNPEQLFAAGYAACFPRRGKTRRAHAQDHAVGGTDRHCQSRHGAGRGRLRAHRRLKVLLPGLEKSVAEEVVAGAHERCPYSNATRGNIDVKLTVL